MKGTKLAIIIEDSEGVRMKVAQWLNKKGYEVLHASNGEEGLQKIKEYERDLSLIISDFNRKISSCFF